MIHDATELGEANRRHAALIAALRDGVVMQDRANVIHACNPAAERILGLTRDEMMGLSSISPNWRAVHEDGTAFPGETHPAPVALRTGMPVHGVVMGVHKPDGSLTWIEVNATPLFYPGDRQAYATVTSFSDITEAKLREMERRQVQRFHESVTDNMPAMIVYWDRSLTCRFANRPCQAWFGFADEGYDAGPGRRGMVGRTMRELFGEAGMLVREACLDRVLAGEAQIFEHDMPRPDGGSRRMRAHYVPDLIDGMVEGFYAMVTDVTEQRQAEERARQTDKMHVIGTLAAGVAHDFNNILQVVMGSLEMIREEVRSGEVAELAASAHDAAKRGSKLTQYLLSYTRQQVLSPAPLDLAGELEDIRIILACTLDPRITIEVRTGAGTPPVWADRAQLQTALLNLGINAAHAMRQGGRMEFTAGLTQGRFGELPEGRYIVIAVSDTGTGLRPDALARAFEPFFSTKGLDGTGLGLAMVQGFSRQSGGDARVMNRTEGGARVEIWLPAVDPGHVLLVDDTPDVLTSTRALLRRSGFGVITAPGGTAAIACLEAGTMVDVLVADYMMPGMTGIELIASARALRPGLPALIITGHAEVAGLGRDGLSANAGGIGLLRKPFTREQLADAVSGLLRQPGTAARARLGATG